MFTKCNIQSSEHNVEITFTCVPYRTGSVELYTDITEMCTREAKSDRTPEKITY